MRKVRVFNFITLDGYFEGPKRDISWHKHDAEGAEYAVEGLKSGGTLLFGRVTYELMASYWPTPLAFKNDPAVAEGMNNADKIVFIQKHQAQAEPETCCDKDIQEWECSSLLPAFGIASTRHRLTFLQYLGPDRKKP
jgi:dihydrofolate reductase